MRRRLLVGAAAAAGTALLPFGGQVAAAGSPRFAIGQQDFLLDGQRLQIRCGEIHFARVPPEYWQHRFRAIKAMGLNTVGAYLFWTKALRCAAPRYRHRRPRGAAGCRM